jgi:hypothetical protein
MLLLASAKQIQTSLAETCTRQDPRMNGAFLRTKKSSATWYPKQSVRIQWSATTARDKEAKKSVMAIGDLGDSVVGM